MNRIATATLAAHDISSPLLVYTYTADADRELLIGLYISGLIGNGSYMACLTKQISGTGTIYQGPTSSAHLAATVTTLNLFTTSIAVESGDIIKVYLQGLATDTSVGIIIEVFDVQSGLTVSGIGSETVTLTIEHNALPVDNAAVWITTDVAGTNTIAGTKYSSMTGLVTFYLDVGTYYVWATKSGIDFGNPNTMVVT